MRLDSKIIPLVVIKSKLSTHLTVSSLVLVLAGLFPAIALPQRGPGRAPFHPSGMPSDLWTQIEALGPRVQIAGKERTVLTGQLTDADGTRRVTVVHELAGPVRIDGASSRGGSIAFDGKQAVPGADTKDEALLESLVSDSAEGLMAAVKEGAPVRLMGLRFRPDPRVEPDYKGPLYDVYQVTSAVSARADRATRAKRYLFDSSTGLLAATLYYENRGGRAVRIETHFLNWTSVGGSAFTGRIERYEDGQFLFRLVVDSADSAPKQDQ